MGAFVFGPPSNRAEKIILNANFETLFEALRLELWACLPSTPPPDKAEHLLFNANQETPVDLLRVELLECCAFDPTSGRAECLLSDANLGIFFEPHTARAIGILFGFDPTNG